MSRTISVNSLAATEATLNDLGTAIQDIGNRVLNLADKLPGTDAAAILEMDLFGISSICNCLGVVARGIATEAEMLRYKEVPTQN